MPFQRMRDWCYDPARAVNRCMATHDDKKLTTTDGLPRVRAMYRLNDDADNDVTLVDDTDVIIECCGLPLMFVLTTKTQFVFWTTDNWYDCKERGITLRFLELMQCTCNLQKQHYFSIFYQEVLFKLHNPTDIRITWAALTSLQLYCILLICILALQMYPKLEKISTIYRYYIHTQSLQKCLCMLFVCTKFFSLQYLSKH